MAVEPDGNHVVVLGSAVQRTSTRSTIKPFQAIPFLTSGAAESFKASEKEIAIACASHDGEPIHTETVAAMLARAGLDESALGCGPQPPNSTEAARELERLGLQPTQLHNNCSGKHCAMLLTAVQRRLPIENYYSPDHKIQQDIISVFCSAAELNPQELTIAIDGCSAPTFAVPLNSIALAFARLVTSEGKAQLTESAAAGRIVSAMIKHPEMIGGTKGRFDSDLLRVAGGKLICKIGAEAVYGIGVLPNASYPNGLGIALKMEDGSYRGLLPAVVETLSQLGILEESEVGELERYHHPPIENRRGTIVGEVRPIFNL